MIEKTVFSDSHRAAISKALTGVMKGVPKSEATKQKMSEMRKEYWRKRREMKTVNVNI